MNGVGDSTHLVPGQHCQSPQVTNLLSSWQDIRRVTPIRFTREIQGQSH